MTAPYELDVEAPSLLEVRDLSDLIYEVATAPVPRYLVRGVVAEGDHGMLGSEFKAGKTWAASDLAVSVASGTDWLNVFPVEVSGPVLLFAGEGGKRKIARRFSAICESRGLDPSTLPIRICLRVPHLTSKAAMMLVEAEVEAHRPTLVIVDPLYLAARGAKGSDIYEMGEHLEGIQHICQAVGSALAISHHWNKTGEGRGAKRMTGVGPESWGRFLISMAVVNRHTDEETKATTVTLDLDLQGDEIAETTRRIVRRVWADDPDDLSSPLHYEVGEVPAFAEPSDPALANLPPSAVRVLTVLEADGDWIGVRAIGDALKGDDTGRGPLKVRTIQTALGLLVKAGLADSTGIVGASGGKWRASRAHSDCLGDENDF